MGPTKVCLLMFRVVYSQTLMLILTLRYWHQGYSIFSKYDDGIWMTDDSWYEVTHECVAKSVTPSALHLDSLT